MRNLEIPTVFMRGGAASGLFFHLADLPEKGIERDQILISAMGSPDPYGMQLDGLGSGNTSTSKCVILSRSSRQEFDVEYLFAQVAVDRAEVDWTRSCGNLAAAAALFAVEESLVKSADEEVVTVRMLQVNRNEAIHAIVEKASGKVWLSFANRDLSRSPIKGPAEKFLVDVPELDEIAITVVDATNIFAFVLSSDLDAALHTTFEFEELKRKAELLRSAVAKVLGLPGNSTSPRILLVDPPTDYRDGSGRDIRAEEVDVIVRALSTHGMHHALPMTAVMATSVGSMIPGTIIHGSSRSVEEGRPVRVGHLSGVDEAMPEFNRDNSQRSHDSIMIALDARRIMTGKVHIVVAG